MVIHIKPFEQIEGIDVLKYSKENPITDEKYELPRGIFKRDGDIFDSLMNTQLIHWESILGNRLISINLNFAYSMYYFEKGIPDKEWFISPGLKGQSIQYFPHFTDEHYSNFYNFCYFVDTFFLKAFTVYETIGHLLYQQFDLPLNEDDWKDQISFNSAIYKLKKINYPLHMDFKKIKNSPEYQGGSKMRNDIAHNHPPYQVSSGVHISENMASMKVGEYTTSAEIKRSMINLLYSIKDTFEVLNKHLN